MGDHWKSGGWDGHHGGEWSESDWAAWSGRDGHHGGEWSDSRIPATPDQVCDDSCAAQIAKAMEVIKDVKVSNAEGSGWLKNGVLTLTEKMYITMEAGKDYMELLENGHMRCNLFGRCDRLRSRLGWIGWCWQ